jgi:hypothetical protein
MKIIVMMAAALFKDASKYYYLHGVMGWYCDESWIRAYVYA